MKVLNVNLYRVISLAFLILGLMRLISIISLDHSQVKIKKGEQSHTKTQTHRENQRKKRTHYNVPLNLSSDEFAPLILSECTFGVPAHAAPCLAESHPHSNIVKGLELIYPSFKLAIPIFPSESHRTAWIKAVADLERCRFKDDWMIYPTEFGQIIELKNAVYRGDPPADTWSNNGCMGDKNSLESMVSDSLDEKQEYDEEILILATSPDSWSFAHFSDRVTNVWQQAQLALSPEERKTATLLTGSKPQSIVNELYTLMGVSKHIHSKNLAAAKRLIYSCRTPLIHPFIHQRISDSYGAPRRSKIPLSKKKKIVYFARGRGDETNGGRKVLNEDEMLKEIEKLLEKRNQGEELVIFDRRDYKDLNYLISFFNNEVKAVIGPHGTAFVNARFAAAEILFVEFMPKGRFQPVFWEQARLLDQKYVVFMLESIDSSHNMKIDKISSLIGILEDHLGKYQKGESVQLAYQWEMKL